MFQKSIGNMIHHCNCLVFIILVPFTVPFYHFLFSRHLSLTKRHFSFLRYFGSISRFELFVQLRRHSMESVFFKSNALFLLLTLQIKYQGQANHDTTFENSQQLTSGINSVDWSGLYLQVYISSWLAIDLIINPPCRTVPQ